MFKAAIFDLDGTLLDSVKDLENACNFALSKFNLPYVDSQNYKLLLGNGRYYMVKSIVEKYFSVNKEEIINQFLNYFNTYYKEHMLDNTKPFNEITKLLEELEKNNIVTAILSNKPDDFTKTLVSNIFKDKVKVTYGLRDGYKAKPNPDTLLDIIDMLKLEKSDCVYIGDTEIDISTAKNANIKSIGVLWGYRSKSLLEQEGADYIASSVKELKDIIINS